MATEVKVTFKPEVLEKIRKTIAKNGIATFFKTVRDCVPNYIPQDTSTLVNSYYVVMADDGNSGCLAYGSRIENDPLNDIAVYQHEKVLNHYGQPAGYSMRLGVHGANIPGSKYAIYGRSLDISISPTLKQQRADYNLGYREKREAGELTPYATKFLEKAVIEAIDKVDFKDVLQ